MRHSYQLRTITCWWRYTAAARDPSHSNKPSLDRPGCRQGKHLHIYYMCLHMAAPPGTSVKATAYLACWWLCGSEDGLTAASFWPFLQIVQRKTLKTYNADTKPYVSLLKQIGFGRSCGNPKKLNSSLNSLLKKNSIVLFGFEFNCFCKPLSPDDKKT